MSAYEQAHAWKDLGIAVIPIIYRGKSPALRSWKRYQSGLPRDRELKIWFGNGRATNLAVVTGWRGLVVVDFDDPMQYSRWLANFHPQRAAAITRTYQVRTARGRHLYFYCEQDVGTHPAIRHRIDIKADGGYVLGPPSIHPAGHQYTPYRAPQHILNIPDLTYLDLEPEQEEITSDGIKSKSLADIAMTETCGVTIEDIKSHYSSAAILGAPPGRRLKINCPLPGHSDDHASFVLYRDGHYHCYGCGAHGRDCIDLHAALHELDLVGAMKEMAKEKGLV